MSKNSNQPRVAVIGGNLHPKKRWKFSERPKIDAETANGIDAWVFAFNAEFIEYSVLHREDLENFDLVLANLNSIPRSYLQLHKHLAENRKSGQKWVCIIEGSALDYLKPDPLLLSTLRAADLVNCINIHSLPLFTNFVGEKAQYIGIPYPVDGVARFRTSIDKRKKEICICPLLMNRWNDYFVAREIGLPYYGFAQLLMRQPKRALYNWKKFGSIFDKERPKRNIQNVFNDQNLEIRSEVPLSQIMQVNGSAWLWLNLDERFTWGRYVLDAAALGIPIITTKSTGHGELLFPETTLDNAFQTDKAIELGKRLVNDREFYEHVAKYPQDKMEQYKPEKMVQKLLTSLGIE